MAEERVLTVPMDAELMTKAEEVYQNLGLDLAEAVRLFAKKSVEMKTSPFLIPPQKSMMGAAAKYANPAMIPFEEGAFARAMVKKHANVTSRIQPGRQAAGVYV